MAAMVESQMVTTTLEAGDDVLMTLMLGPARDDEGVGCRVVDHIVAPADDADGPSVGYVLTSLNDQDVRDLDFVHILQFLREAGGLPRPVRAVWAPPRDGEGWLA